MKKLILILLLLPLMAFGKSLGTDITLATSSGTVAGNAKRVTLIFSSDFTGTVGGVAFAGATDSSVTFSADQPGDTLAAIAYTVTAGNVRIVRIQ